MAFDKAQVRKLLEQRDNRINQLMQERELFLNERNQLNRKVEKLEADLAAVKRTLQVLSPGESEGEVQP